jgi:hypothetical protein
LERLQQTQQFALEKVHVLELINVSATVVSQEHNAKQCLQRLPLNHHQNLLQILLLVLENFPQIQKFVLLKESVPLLTNVLVTVDILEMNVKP